MSSGDWMEGKQFVCSHRRLYSSLLGSLLLAFHLNFIFFHAFVPRVCVLSMYVHLQVLYLEFLFCVLFSPVLTVSTFQPTISTFGDVFLIDSQDVITPNWDCMMMLRILSFYVESSIIRLVRGGKNKLKGSSIFWSFCWNHVFHVQSFMFWTEIAVSGGMCCALWKNSINAPVNKISCPNAESISNNMTRTKIQKKARNKRFNKVRQYVYALGGRTKKILIQTNRVTRVTN